MRFSSVFQSPFLPAAPRREAPVRVEEPQREVVPPAPQELPDDLDARVRLVGEWQLGED